MTPEGAVTFRAGSIHPLSGLVRTLWECGNFSNCARISGAREVTEADSSVPHCCVATAAVELLNIVVRLEYER